MVVSIWPPECKRIRNESRCEAVESILLRPQLFPRATGGRHGGGVGLLLWTAQPKRGDLYMLAYLGALKAEYAADRPATNETALMRTFTLPGELVLDPFAGSGSMCELSK